MKPMSEAPRDGTKILLRVYGCWHEGQWKPGAGFRRAAWVIFSPFFEGRHETPCDDSIDGWLDYPA